MIIIIIRLLLIEKFYLPDLFVAYAKRDNYLLINWAGVEKCNVFCLFVFCFCFNILYNLSENGANHLVFSEQALLSSYIIIAEGFNHGGKNGQECFEGKSVGI